MMLTVKEVARLFSVSEKSVYKWISRRKIPAYKIGESYRFNRVELLEWATGNKIAVSPDIMNNSFEDDNSLTSLTSAVMAGGIHREVPGDDTASVLAAIVEIIRLPQGIDRRLLTDALIARENLGTTAIGHGIAIPHVRNPVVFHIETPVLALCFLNKGVDFNALDKKPVDRVFTIVSPNVRTHLNTLSRLSFALHRSDIRASIDPGKSDDDILAALKRFEESLDNSHM